VSTRLLSNLLGLPRH